VRRCVIGWSSIRDDGGDLYALLAVMPRERNQLGMELIGDQVQRDVKQKTLSFVDHELYAVAESMPDTGASSRVRSWT
jgi:hypothetical protein